MSQPNILFISTDQESVSLSGCYGNTLIKTPARDSIAQNGMRFDNHYIASFPCCPSRATMITGLFPHHHGVVDQNIVLEQSVETLGSQLKRAGYATSWIGKSHLGGWFEPHDEPTCPHSTCEMTDMGYQLTHQTGGAGGEDYALNGFDNWISGWTDYRNYLQTTDLPDEIKRDRWVGGHAVMETARDSEHAYSRLTAEHHMAHWMADEAIKVIEGAKESEQPFCLKLAFYAPHHPVAPPKPYDTMYSIDDIELPESYAAGTDAKNMPGVHAECGHNRHVASIWTDEQAKGYLARYYGYVSYTDDQMTRVLEALKATGQHDNTIIVFTSDHGDMLCEQGMIYKHPYCGYDTLMKVPMLVQWPDGLPAGTVHAGLSSHVDIVPTLLALAEVEPSAASDGVSLADVLRGSADSARDEIFEDVYNRGYMTRQGPWKFVLNAGLTGGEAVRKLDELYNLETDPGEVSNLAGKPEQAARVAEMKERVLEWLATSGHPYADKIRQAAELPVSGALNRTLLRTLNRHT
ncbi:MAG: sulfatase-like hydrolase/transferase [Verrucomicrobia bacterium]|jgi:arylsulfatase|nr:sulfatase-like hydrolase/transferase [Verrucomicrobiota bacterium]MBT7067712.1 sulfatase-like hydrolase/transferase [Verrucomicrobiota bacterium]MBT7699684.1 sulfatase-like hydrolase/transferase [Verrucomicrobiota bacterium]